MPQEKHALSMSRALGYGSFLPYVRRLNQKRSTPKCFQKQSAAFQSAAQSLFLTERIREQLDFFQSAFCHHGLSIFTTNLSYEGQQIKINQQIDKDISWKIKNSKYCSEACGAWLQTSPNHWFSNTDGVILTIFTPHVYTYTHKYISDTPKHRD